MKDLLLYDGVCGLCNRLTQFLLRHDRHDRFRFAALQSPLAARVLAKYGRDPRDLETIVLVADFDRPGERLLDRGRAIRYAVVQLGGGFRAARLLWIVPLPLLDWVYRRVARSRYAWFGKLDGCLVPTARDRSKFLDVA